MRLKKAKDKKNHIIFRNSPFPGYILQIESKCSVLVTNLNQQKEILSTMLNTSEEIGVLLIKCINDKSKNLWHYQ